jgi:hypothetical protein
MAYVSAKFIMAADGSTDTQVVATDDGGHIVWIPIPHTACDVGDWVEYLAAGGTIDAYVPGVPPDLFGGPNLEDTYSGNN